MTSLYRDLAWLPVVPSDFRARCRAAVDAEDPQKALRTLSMYALDGLQLRKLADTLDSVKAKEPLAGLTPFTLGVLGNATLTEIVPALRATALRYSIDLTVVKADYGQMMQEALALDSRINGAAPDAVLLAVDYRGFGLDRPFFDISAEEEAIASAVAFIRSLRNGFKMNSNAPCLVQSVPPPAETIFGSADRTLPGGVRRMFARVNAAIAESLADGTDMLVDIASLAETVGLAEWHSPTQWNVAKFSFDSVFVPIYAEHVCRVLGTLTGKSRRCLILDLDNTVWGGVIGDDGMDGILIGQGDATGEAHLAVQHMALTLRERGIVLAVSSKNTDSIARRVFAEHPEMALRENHIAVFQANWNDKATNITAIANELSLGLQSMVFLDDNPVERNLVRQMLPEVAVPELPEDPALYARTLNAAGYFETTTFSDEDRKRAEYYQDNAKRAQLQGAVGDLEAYLRSLQMCIDFRPFDGNGRQRIAQLISKSNQFNLTTKRYTESEVEALELDDAVFTMQVRLTDTFGDNGMISVIVCKPCSPTEWIVDTWLMSCRVLGRRVEPMVLREILKHAHIAGVERLRGMYIPTAKNDLVKDHYAKLGFTLDETQPDGQTHWSLPVATEIDAAPMEVCSSGFHVPVVSGSFGDPVAAQV